MCFLLAKNTYSFHLKKSCHHLLSQQELSWRGSYIKFFHLSLKHPEHKICCKRLLLNTWYSSKYFLICELWGNQKHYFPNQSLRSQVYSLTLLDLAYLSLFQRWYFVVPKQWTLRFRVSNLSNFYFWQINDTLNLAFESFSQI